MVILFKPEQPAKAPSPISVTESGIVIVFKFEHSRKLQSPILVTELGIVIVVKFKHLSKALSPIFENTLGITTSVREVSFSFFKTYSLPRFSYSNASRGVSSILPEAFATLFAFIGVWFCFAPHSEQNFAPIGRYVPHFMQLFLLCSLVSCIFATSDSSFPQEGQKQCSPIISALHDGQKYLGKFAF